MPQYNDLNLLKRVILHIQHFYFWYLEYILLTNHILILMFSEMSNTRLSHLWKRSSDKRLSDGAQREQQLPANICQSVNWEKVKSHQLGAGVNVQRNVKWDICMFSVTDRSYDLLPHRTTKIVTCPILRWYRSHEDKWAISMTTALFCGPCFNVINGQWR